MHPKPNKKDLIEHLTEFRKRLIIIIISIIFFFIIGFVFSNSIIKRIQQDLILPENVRLVTLTPLELIYTQIKIGFFVSLIMGIPLILYELFKFIRPGLTKRERFYIKFILPVSSLLFIIGFLFAYFILIRFALYFFAQLSVGAGVENLWGIQYLISFISSTCLTMGIIFQMPLALLLLKKLGVIDIKSLRKKRRYVYTLIFIAAAIITPSTDAIIQIMVVIPLILLYEISVLVVIATDTNF